MQLTAQTSSPSSTASRLCELSVIIVSWNTRALLRRCIECLQQELAGLDAEVFVVDNCSSDASADMVADCFPEVHLIRNKRNLGFAAANNQAMRAAAGRRFLLLNPDTEVQPGSIRRLLSFLEEHPDAGVVAPQLLNTDGSIQRSCRQFPTFAGMVFELIGLSRMFPHEPRFRQYKMLDFDHRSERQVDQPEGACLLVRREVVDSIGMLDEGYFMLFEEVDWCYVIKEAGWQIWFTPRAQVIHHYGQSIKQVKAKMIFSSHRGLYRFWRKHYCSDRIMLAPLFYLGLMALAVLRVVTHTVRSTSSNLLGRQQLSGESAT